MNEDGFTEISVPVALAERIDGYLRQLREMQGNLQLTIDTAAIALGVPLGARYDPEQRKFIMLAPAPEIDGPVVENRDGSAR